MSKPEKTECCDICKNRGGQKVISCNCPCHSPQVKSDGLPEVTCLSLDCPEREGGKCNVLERMKPTPPLPESDERKCIFDNKGKLDVCYCGKHWNPTLDEWEAKTLEEWLQADFLAGVPYDLNAIKKAIADWWLKRLSKARQQSYEEMEEIINGMKITNSSINDCSCERCIIELGTKEYNSALDDIKNKLAKLKE